MTPTKPDLSTDKNELSTTSMKLSTEKIDLSTASAYVLAMLREVLALNEADHLAEYARRREREDAMALLGYAP